MSGPAAPARSIWFWPALLVGWAAIGFGLLSLVRNAPRTHPVEFGLWFAGSVLAHDLLIAPLVFAVGHLLRRRVGPGIRPVLQGALIVSAVVALVSFPVVAGYGRSAGNPSRLPRDYGLGLAVTLTAVWIAAGVLWLSARWCARRRRPVEVLP